MDHFECLTCGYVGYMDIIFDLDDPDKEYPCPECGSPHIVELMSIDYDLESFLEEDEENEI
jgi:rubredoxin